MSFQEGVMRGKEERQTFRWRRSRTECLGSLSQTPRLWLSAGSNQAREKQQRHDQQLNAY